MKFYAPKYKQLDLGLLRPSLDELDKTNRRVALGDLLPWTELENEYNSRQENQKKGAGNKTARMILGAMIIDGYAFTDRHSRDACNGSRNSCYRSNFSKNASAAFRPPPLLTRFI